MSVLNFWLFCSIRCCWCPSFGHACFKMFVEVTLFRGRSVNAMADRFMHGKIIRITPNQFGCGAFCCILYTLQVCSTLNASGSATFELWNTMLDPWNWQPAAARFRYPLLLALAKLGNPARRTCSLVKQFSTGWSLADSNPDADTALSRKKFDRWDIFAYACMQQCFPTAVVRP